MVDQLKGEEIRSYDTVSGVAARALLLEAPS